MCPQYDHNRNPFPFSHSDNRIVVVWLVVLMLKIYSFFEWCLDCVSCSHKSIYTIFYKSFSDFIFLVQFFQQEDASIYLLENTTLENKSLRLFILFTLQTFLIFLFYYFVCFEKVATGRAAAEHTHFKEKKNHNAMPACNNLKLTWAHHFPPQAHYHCLLVGGVPPADRTWEEIWFSYEDRIKW